jgi:hypothetical protein
VSVVAPPDTPPEVQRPYDEGTEPSAPRVVKYRAWTRGKQLGQVTFTATALIVAVAIIVAAGDSPGAPVGELLARLGFFTVVWAVVQALTGRRKLRWQIESAWPLPDGAREGSLNAARVLLAPPALIGGALLGVFAGVGTIALGGDAGEVFIPVLGGIGLGRILGLELQLRLLVERPDRDRIYFVSLEDDDDENEPLFWRFTRD